jgi:hypothetical protein
LQGVVAVAGEHAVGDLAGVVVGAHHLLAVAQLGRVEVRGAVSLAGISVEEDRPALGVGAAGAGRRLGDQQDAVAGARLAQAAAQRVAAFGDELGSQPVARLVQSGRSGLLQFGGGIALKSSVLVMASVSMHSSVANRSRPSWQESDVAIRRRRRAESDVMQAAIHEAQSGPRRLGHVRRSPREILLLSAITCL